MTMTKQCFVPVAAVLAIVAASTARAADLTPRSGPPSAAASAVSAAAANTPSNSPARLPGKGLAQHPFLYAGEYDYLKPFQTLWVMRDGKPVWSYAIPTKLTNGELQEFGDAFMLSNGNVLFTRKTGASEVTPDKRLVWNLDAPKGCEIHTAQPVGLDQVLVMQNGKPAKAMLINKHTGKVEKELTLPTSPTGAHGQFRHIRLTKAGTLLVAHLDWGNVVEYTWEGKEIWAWPGRGDWSSWAAVRLNNGNTLVSGNGMGDVVELNSKGEIVWQFGQKDVPDIKLYVIQEADRLANGNTLLCNWCAGTVNPKDWPTTVQILEVTPDKKVVWALRSWSDPDFGPATSIQLLDEHGIPENGDLQR
jgi:hypothetical protein